MYHTKHVLRTAGKFGLHVGDPSRRSNGFDLIGRGFSAQHLLSLMQDRAINKVCWVGSPTGLEDAVCSSAALELGMPAILAHVCVLGVTVRDT
jgi:hypothetical protein